MFHSLLSLSLTLHSFSHLSSSIWDHFLHHYASRPYSYWWFSSYCEEGILLIACFPPIRKCQLLHLRFRIGLWFLLIPFHLTCCRFILYLVHFIFHLNLHFLSSNNIIMWFFFLFFFIRSKYNGIEWKRDFDRIKEERKRTTHSIPISCSWVKWMKRNGITRQRGVRYSFTLTLFAFLFISLHTTQRGNWKGMEWK